MAEFERALALNPSFTDWRYAAVLAFAGHFERAIDAAKAYLRVDPFALPIARGYLGLAHLMARRYSEAVPPIREFVAIAQSSWRASGWWLLMVTWGNSMRRGFRQIEPSA